MRSASSPPSRPISLRMRPNPSWVEIVARPGGSIRAGGAIRGAARRRGKPAANGTPARNSSSASSGMSIPAKRSHSSPGATPISPRKVSICSGVIRPAWLSLCPAKGKAVALGGVADQAGRPVVVDAVEGVQQHVDVVAREVGHQRVQGRIVAALHQDPRVVVAGEILHQPLAPPRAALEGERGIERVRAVVDPGPERRPAGLGEGGLLQPAVFQRQHPPADRAEQLVDAPEQPVRDHRIEALAVVVDHPPEVPHVVLPALQQGLEHVALVELGIAHQRDHPPGIAADQPLAGEIVPGERGGRRSAPRPADRAGREVDVVVVLCARGVGLGAAEAAEALEPLAALMAEQVLDGVEDGRRRGA